jgi:enoyl reductase
MGRAALASCLVLASGWFTVLASAPSALAVSGAGCGTSSGGTSGGGSVTGSQVTMWASLTKTEHLCSSGSSSITGGTSWTPPACWWAPEYTPEELYSTVGQLDQSSSQLTYSAFQQEYDVNGDNGHGGLAPLTPGYLSTDGPKWQSYNVGAGPAGTWWGLIWNDDDTLTQMQQCSDIDTKHFPEDWYWVPTGGAAPATGDAPPVTAEQLALYVASKVQLPPLQVQASPALGSKSTVNLPTWVWAAAADTSFSVNDICLTEDPAICVNLTAQAESFTLGTDPSDSVLYNTGCTLDQTTGTIGTPYAGSKGDPPCGVTFTNPENYNLKVLTSWLITVTWNGGQWQSPQPLPTTETDEAVTAQEVQTINNG